MLAKAKFQAGNIRGGEGSFKTESVKNSLTSQKWDTPKTFVARRPWKRMVEDCDDGDVRQLFNWRCVGATFVRYWPEKGDRVMPWKRTSEHSLRRPRGTTVASSWSTNFENVSHCVVLETCVRTLGVSSASLSLNAYLLVKTVCTPETCRDKQPRRWQTAAELTKWCKLCWSETGGYWNLSRGSLKRSTLCWAWIRLSTISMAKAHATKPGRGWRVLISWRSCTAG